MEGVRELFFGKRCAENSGYLPVRSLNSWLEKPLIPIGSLKSRDFGSFRKKLEKIKKG